MMDIYDKIHARERVEDILTFIKDTQLILNEEEFIAQLKTVIDRNPYYAKRLLKELINYYEAMGSEFVQAIYEYYINLLNVGAPKPQDTDIIQYRFGEYKILIEENPSLICAQGTTGFRTWEAALYLCHYMVQNERQFSSYESILELGCGTAIISILYKMLAPQAQLKCTDGDSNLLDQVKKNFELNGMKSTPSLQQLRWNTDDIPDNTQLVLAADVTYDTSVIPDLVECLVQCKGSNVYIACTERNLDTLKVFEETLSKYELEFSVVSSVSPSRFKQLTDRNITTYIRIYRIIVPT